MTKPIGKELRQLRIAAGLTQREAAKLLGCHWTAISKYELETSWPSVQMLQKINRVYAAQTESFAI